MAIVMQASGIPGVDMGAASIKMNEDGSFNLLVGATDIGTGADTMFCQVAAEALGVRMEKIIPYSSDTDMGHDLTMALDQLDPELRAAVTLVDLEGFRQREAAEMLDIAEGTVASRLFRARRALRRFLAPSWEAGKAGRQV